jgi:hypothetical protein
MNQRIDKLEDLFSRLQKQIEEVRHAKGGQTIVEARGDES